MDEVARVFRLKVRQQMAVLEEDLATDPSLEGKTQRFLKHLRSRCLAQGGQMSFVREVVQWLQPMLGVQAKAKLSG